MLLLLQVPRVTIAGGTPLLGRRRLSLASAIDRVWAVTCWHVNTAAFAHTRRGQHQFEFELQVQLLPAPPQLLRRSRCYSRVPTNIGCSRVTISESSRGINVLFGFNRSRWWQHDRVASHKLLVPSPALIGQQVIQRVSGLGCSVLPVRSRFSQYARVRGVTLPGSAQCHSVSASVRI